LNRVLLANEAEVKSLGYNILQIGSYSTRNGAASSLSSMPGKFFSSMYFGFKYMILIFLGALHITGGPSSAACSLCGGWSMET
jgi:hypothetical protein